MNKQYQKVLGSMSSTQDEIGMKTADLVRIKETIPGLREKLDQIERKIAAGLVDGTDVAGLQRQRRDVVDDLDNALLTCPELEARMSELENGLSQLKQERISILEKLIRKWLQTEVAAHDAESTALLQRRRRLVTAFHLLRDESIEHAFREILGPGWQFVSAERILFLDGFNMTRFAESKPRPSKDLGEQILAEILK